MDDRRMVKISKYLAKHLRHRPDRIGLTLTADGWADVDELLVAARRHGFPITRAELEQVVAANDKRRYAYDGRRIRASQGHSVPVDLGLASAAPPPVLFHGTVAPALDAIMSEGLLPMGRHAVHLSADRATAERVGARRGAPVVLAVAAAEMAADGHEFHLSENGVWLVGHVPVRYLTRQSARTSATVSGQDSGLGSPSGTGPSCGPNR
ncbi:RNA 2'-phosphotransferase [Actinomadura logoneensis]|uniref:Probable RNA 2'-phosphotransferase n=1 Tax=Actinomadura logoneensis TaxID=2293572 RepID=A0A372JRC1_9ACTN|nr:RNA 2'-phosphotransferase [Actinomadura logoneensis]RFU42499.1 RNA 2'-phosphotransferase [Actinomadura logoneensis]